jgi:hypothetical protein
VCVVSYNPARSCTEQSFETRTCTKHRKHNEFTQWVPALGHNWGSWRGFGTTQTRTCLRDTSHTETRVNPNPGTVTVSTPDDYAAALADIASGGNNQNYTIVLANDLVVPGSSTSVYPFGTSANITVTITGNHKLTLGTPGNLLHTVANQNIILWDVKLVGYNTNSMNSLINVESGSVTMNGNSSISGNIMPGGHGAAVWIGNGGTFTMNSGTITGNYATGTNASNGGGGGVYMYTGGTFIMNGGTIRGNSAGYDGGGVYLGGGTFTLNTSASSISGNTPNQVAGTGTINGTAGVTAGW